MWFRQNGCILYSILYIVRMKLCQTLINDAFSVDVFIIRPEQPVRILLYLQFVLIFFLFREP